MTDLPDHIKYRLYEKSVQNCGNDVDFISEEFQRLRKRCPFSLEENFGGTGALACRWVEQGRKYTAHAIDFDEGPIAYGKKNHYAKLTKGEQGRIRYIKGNVLDNHKLKSDVATAFNFSYFVFKKRKEMLKYIKRVRKSLVTDGIFFMDIFGGSECRSPLEEETEFSKHSYYWDCDSYNPLRNEVVYHIHFKHKNKKYQKVFSYDWRMWSPMEIVELMEEAGFSKVLTYWEGDDGKGGGDGCFVSSASQEQCDSWIAYILGLV